MPALLTRMSSPPKESTTWPTARRTDSSSETSATTPSTPSGAADGSRSSAATRAPPATSTSTIAAPMPDAPPVTAAERPANSPLLIRGPRSKRSGASIRMGCSSAGLPCHDGLALPAEPVDLDLDHVARGQVGEAPGERDALRRPREYDVARLEREVLAQVVHHVRDVEDLVGGRRVLPRLAVHPAPQRQ